MSEQVKECKAEVVEIAESSAWWIAIQKYPNMDPCLLGAYKTRQEAEQAALGYCTDESSIPLVAKITLPNHPDSR